MNPFNVTHPHHQLFEEIFRQVFGEGVEMTAMGGGKCGLTCVDRDTAEFPLGVLAGYMTDEEVVWVMCVSPMILEPDHRAKVAEFLAWLNYVLRYGAVGLNLDRGDVVYRHSVNLTGSKLTPEMLRTMKTFGGQAMACVKKSADEICLGAPAAAVADSLFKDDTFHPLMDPEILEIWEKERRKDPDQASTVMAKQSETVDEDVLQSIEGGVLR